jgi:hypothetical protein
MIFFYINVSQVSQSIDGLFEFDNPSCTTGGIVSAYRMDIDTRHGGVGPNAVWLRVGVQASDWCSAETIVAGTGTEFTPQAIGRLEQGQSLE